VQKPRGLTTPGRSDGINFIYLNSRFLTKVFDGNFIPTNGGQGHWLFHSNLAQKKRHLQIDIVSV